MPTHNNRHLRGATNEIMLRVNGGTVVNVGDLMFIDATAGARHSATITYAGFPANMCASNTHYYFESNFAGVAMSSSISGVTEDIPVATSGVFRFPVTAAAGQTVSPSFFVSGASFGANGTSIFAQKVVCGPVLNEGRIGYCVRAQTATSTVDFIILTRFSGVSPDVSYAAA